MNTTDKIINEALKKILRLPELGGYSDIITVKNLLTSENSIEIEVFETPYKDASHIFISIQLNIENVYTLCSVYTKEQKLITQIKYNTQEVESA